MCLPSLQGCELLEGGPPLTVKWKHKNKQTKKPQNLKPGMQRTLIIVQVTISVSYVLYIVLSFFFNK